MKKFFSRSLSKVLVSTMILGQLLTNAPTAQAAGNNDPSTWGMYKYKSTNKVSEANSDLERRLKNITDYYVETINNQNLTAIAEEDEKLPNGTLLKDYLAAKYPILGERTNGDGKKEYVYNTGILGDPIVNGSTFSYRRIAAGLFNKRMGGSDFYFTQDAPSDFSAQVDKWTEGITKYAEPGTEVVNDDNDKLTIEKRYGDYDMDMKEMISLIYTMKSSLGDGNNYVMSNTAIKNIINNGLRPALRPWQNCMHIALKLDLNSDYYSNLPNYALSSETENHVLMTLSSIYLTNQWIEKNYRGLNIQSVEGCSNTPEFKDMLLQVLARIVHSDFFETNGRNYQTFTMHSLLNLYAFSEDETIRAGAKNALDFATAKFAFQSFEGKRIAPHRRNIEYDSRLDFYENDSTVFVMNTLSGVSVWNDNITGNWNVDKDNYFMGRYAQGMGHSLWAALMSTGIFVKNYYTLQPTIHDFMLDKHNGYWARMQARYTGKNYRMEFSNDPNSKDADPLYFDGSGKINLWEGPQNSPRYWIEHELSLNQDVAHLQLLRDSDVTFQSAPELYFVAPDYINISGGKKQAYPTSNEEIATQITELGEELGFIKENWGKILITRYLSPIDGLIAGTIDEWESGPQDEVQSLGKKTGLYDFKAFPSTVLGKGFTGNWWSKTVVPVGSTKSKAQISTEAFKSDNIALSSEWDPEKWSESNNLGTYKSVSYGLNINVPSSWTPLSENGVSDFYSYSDAQKLVKFNFYDFPSSPNNYIVVATINGTNKGLWEIVPKKRFNNNFTDLKTSVLNNNAYFLSTANAYTYKMTNGETLALSTAAGANGENPILGIKASDGTALEMNNVHVGGNTKEMPLIDVCEVDENYNLTGVKYAYSIGDGKVFICNPYVTSGYAKAIWIDSSDYKNPTSSLPYFLTMGNGTNNDMDYKNSFRTDGWFGDSNEGGGVAVGDIDKNGIQDIVFFFVDDPSSSNTGYYRIGWNIDRKGEPTSWSDRKAVPGWIGSDTDGADVAITDFNNDGTLDLVFCHEDDPSGENSAYYRIGFGIDNNGDAYQWSDVKNIPTWFGGNNQGLGVTVGDIDGNGQKDMIVANVDDPSGANRICYRIGWNLNTDGNAANWSTPAELLSGIGDSTSDVGIALSDIDKNGKQDLMVFFIDDPSDENRGSIYIGWDLDSTGKVKSWTHKSDLIGGIGSATQGAGMAIADVDKNGRQEALFFHIDDPGGANTGYYRWMPLGNEEMPTIYIADDQNLMTESYGPVNIRGWLIDGKPVSKLDVLLDGSYYTTATYGSSRTDLLKWYPQYKNPNCGFSFTLDRSNLSYGEHTLALLLTSSDGTQKYCPLMPKMLGVPTIGYIDAPANDSKISGTVAVKGWVQSGNGITLTDGVSKIDVLIDGKYKGTATYGLERKDVLTVFPEYKFENSGFYYDLDTSSLSSGKHNISLSVTTKTGRVVSIGNTAVTVSEGTPPSIGSVSASTRLIKNGTFNVKIKNVTDVDSTVDNVSVTLTKTGEAFSQTFNAVNIGNNNYEAIIDTDTEGEYKYSIKAVDGNGNAREWKWSNGLTTQTVYVNKNAPQNWSLNKTATASVMDWYSEIPSKAVNGTYKDDISDKWCTGYGKGTNSWLQVDLGEAKEIDRWKVINESGSGSGYTQFTTKDFSFKYSNDGFNWLTADTVTNNILGITDRRIPQITARYIKLDIATGDSDGCARIYEFQAYKEASYTDDDVTITIPTVTPTPTPTPKVGNINVKMFNGTTTDMTSSINPKIKITNQGATAVDLANVKLRYYYTSDGEQAQSFVCDWAVVGNGNVTSKFTKLATPKTDANYYLEIGFATGAGTLQPGASTEVQVRFNKNDWTNYTQTGDYSFNSSATSYVDWTKISSYMSGSLVWGVEP